MPQVVNTYLWYPCSFNHPIEVKAKVAWIHWCTEAGWEDQVILTQNRSSLEDYCELVTKWVKAGAEIAAIRQRLMEQGYTGSYAALWRFVRRLRPSEKERTTVRVETKPGEEAQVDFGYAERMIDPATG